MADFFELDEDDRREALALAAQRAGSHVVLLEKDVWVVWTLNELFTAPFGEHLVFKGGTSLSKAYRYIPRFSEDIDVTYDIRAIAPDLVGGVPEPLPANRSQAGKWTDAIRARLRTWVAESVVPQLATALGERGGMAAARAADDQVFIEYPPLERGIGYVAPAVRIDFGARSTGEPATPRAVSCDAAPHLPDVGFPTAVPRVMSAERTFWEKTTAIHVFCLQDGKRGGDRFARHWYDVDRLDQAGVAASAFADRALARRVADHKRLFFRENDATGTVVDYLAAVDGGLRLVPSPAAQSSLERDYGLMIEEGLLGDDAIPFADLMERCRVLETRANS